MENVEFRKRQLNKVVLSADFRPPRLKRVVRPARSCLYTPSEAAPLSRTGQHLCPERGSTSVPNEAVPLPRARQYLCPEWGGTSVPSETVPLSRTRRYL